MGTLSIRTREQVLNVQLLGEGCPHGVAAKDLCGSIPGELKDYRERQGNSRSRVAQV